MSNTNTNKAANANAETAAHTTTTETTESTVIQNELSRSLGTRHKIAIGAVSGMAILGGLYAIVGTVQAVRNRNKETQTPEAQPASMTAAM